MIHTFLFAAVVVGSPPPEAGDPTPARVAQYSQVLPDPAQRCPQDAPSRYREMAQYVVWQCVRNGKAQYDFYGAAGYSHSLILPN